MNVGCHYYNGSLWTSTYFALLIIVNFVFCLSQIFLLTEKSSDWITFCCMTMAELPKSFSCCLICFRFPGLASVKKPCVLKFMSVFSAPRSRVMMITSWNSFLPHQFSQKVFFSTCNVPVFLWLSVKGAFLFPGHFPSCFLIGCSAVPSFGTLLVF